MSKKMNLRLSIIPLVLLVFLLNACGESDSPSAVSKEFWQAVQSKDMESAKEFSTWETVVYLKFLNADTFKPERFELGEEMIGETRAEVETTLYTSKLGESGVKLPGVTVLVKTDKGWRVNVKKSMTSVVKNSANNVFDQLNGLMQEGIDGLDNSLSEALNELGGALDEGAEELKRELNKPFFTPDD